MTQTFDVAVIGAGPAGSATALLLARQGLSVAVCDGPRRRTLSIGETLPRHASELLRRLGLWEGFCAQSHLPSPGMMSAWGSPNVWTTDYLFSPLGNGWHLDRTKFNDLLIETAARAGVTLLRETRVTACEKGDADWRLATRDAHGRQKLACHFVVDACGRTSGLSLGPMGRLVSDRLVAVACLCMPASSATTSSYTLVEAVDQGWFYSALLPSGYYIVTYVTDADLHSDDRKRSIRFFEDQLKKAPHTRERTGGITSAFSIIPAFSSMREHAADRNWLAVGDAARSYDPLSGMGLCMSMSMAIDAADAIARRFHGDVSGLESYELLNRQAYAEYIQAHGACYRLEQRWPECGFWRRRHNMSDLDNLRFT
ncbi:NAD(P)/FAD-dependent oxidoreductase [uncultured Paludibaculum sp.]|uniref:NAD(P)/FAD-dependent oxidoreductase n=1 Tax=uncultured Paludibaculum sp. TaxID=1765020 RepID=UPI002AAA7B9C|nr:NAD(P)/FAD-dependent oxidoreductase [uncultured Paludibaculum sp.]